MLFKELHLSDGRKFKVGESDVLNIDVRCGTKCYFLIKTKDSTIFAVRSGALDIVYGETCDSVDDEFIERLLCQGENAEPEINEVKEVETVAPCKVSPFTSKTERFLFANPVDTLTRAANFYFSERKSYSVNDFIEDESFMELRTIRDDIVDEASNSKNVNFTIAKGNGGQAMIFMDQSKIFIKEEVMDTLARDILKIAERTGFILGKPEFDGDPYKASVRAVRDLIELSEINEDGLSKVFVYSTDASKGLVICKNDSESFRANLFDAVMAARFWLDFA